MLIVLLSLFLGIVTGFLGQRSRMCFIGGIRDYFLVKDKELIKGLISFFSSAGITYICIGLISKLFISSSSLSVSNIYFPSFIDILLSKQGTISIIGGIGLGFFATLSGGCPIRHHVMAGQGRIDSILYLLGFYSGIFVFYFLILRYLSNLLY